MIEYRNLYWDAPDHSRMQAEIKHPDFGWPLEDRRPCDLRLDSAEPHPVPSSQRTCRVKRKTTFRDLRIRADTFDGPLQAVPVTRVFHGSSFPVVGATTCLKSPNPWSVEGSPSIG